MPYKNHNEFFKNDPLNNYVVFYVVSLRGMCVVIGDLINGAHTSVRPSVHLSVCDDVMCYVSQGDMSVGTGGVTGAAHTSVRPSVCPSVCDDVMGFFHRET